MRRVGIPAAIDGRWERFRADRTPKPGDELAMLICTRALFPRRDCAQPELWGRPPGVGGPAQAQFAFSRSLRVVHEAP